jgi:hypothetical protein
MDESLEATKTLSLKHPRLNGTESPHIMNSQKHKLEESI